MRGRDGRRDRPHGAQRRGSVDRGPGLAVAERSVWAPRDPGSPVGGIERIDRDRARVTGRARAGFGVVDVVSADGLLWAKAHGFGLLNQVVLPPLAPGKQPLPYLPPDALYAMCRYDISVDSLTVTAAMAHAGWTLSLHTPQGDNFYVMPAQETRRAEISLVVVPGAERLLFTGTPEYAAGRGNRCLFSCGRNRVAGLRSILEVLDSVSQLPLELTSSLGDAAFGQPRAQPSDPGKRQKSVIVKVEQKLIAHQIERVRTSCRCEPHLRAQLFPVSCLAEFRDGKQE